MELVLSSTRTEHFKLDFLDISKSDGASPIEIIFRDKIKKDWQQN